MLRVHLEKLLVSIPDRDSTHVGDLTHRLLCELLVTITVLAGSNLVEPERQL
jgi:hypothetical protein